MVGRALSLLESMGTSAKDFLRLLKKVGPLVVAIFIRDNLELDLEEEHEDAQVGVVLICTDIYSNECKHNKFKHHFAENPSSSVQDYLIHL